MRIRQALRPLAWTLAACALFTVSWAAYMVTDPFAGIRQAALQQQLDKQWRTAPPAAQGQAAIHRAAGHRPAKLRVHTGKPFALIRVPAFGRTWRFAIVEGTGASQLALGPGHVQGTGLPGQPGNFVVAAHDVTAGNAFAHLHTLHYPDRVLIYTRSHIYTYVVRAERVVKYTDVGVEYPVPGHPRAAPRRSLITLITCTPETLTFTPWRIIVTGELTHTSPRG